MTFIASPETAAARKVELADGPTWVYPLIGVFGANASGKSNVLAALRDMRDAVLNSYALWASFRGVPRYVFSLDSKCVGEPSFFEVDVVIDGVRWTYGFELGPERVEAEWVHSYPRGRRQEWLDRDASRPEPYHWPGNRVRDRAQLARRTRPDALLLSTAGTDNHPQLSALFSWFQNNLGFFVGPEVEPEKRWGSTALQLEGDLGPRIRELLRVADLGITGVDVDRGKTPQGGRHPIQLLHRSAGGGEVAFDWQQESFGTRSWFALLGPMLQALEMGAVLLIDELDASLHSRIAAEVIRIFADPDANPAGAQLIFTSHDATLLSSPSGERLLEPEQVWLTEKDEDGATQLYSLTEAQPGKEENLTVSYLEGAFGAVPDVLEGQIARRIAARREPGQS
ncbi:AAA family ATPase [Streptosporangium subroseum]|uniref:AAA family ATPase n=1 Tax=Streptosporangium subroseum TaxID=106412 RepID=UPI001FE576FB|nr:ATP-binding protein [Streptosporangium subroseum]